MDPQVVVNPGFSQAEKPGFSDSGQVPKGGISKEGSGGLPAESFRTAQCANDCIRVETCAQS